MPGEARLRLPKAMRFRQALVITALWGFSATGCAGGPSPMQRAVMLSRAGNDRQAIQLLEAHLDIHRDDLAVRRLLVRLYGAVGDMGRAEGEARELATRLGPSSPVPWLELGRSFELAHRYEDALAQYDHAGVVAPDDPTGPRVGGLRAARWGLTELAAPRLEEAAKRDPKSAEVWHALGLVRLHSGDLAGARRAYHGGLRADPDSLDNRLGLATVALAAHEPENALIEYEHILRVRPRYHDALLGRAWSLILLGRLTDAREALEAARLRGAQPEIVAAQERELDRRQTRRLRHDNH
jgi:tetratricopeptide (TPR) repeat protein